MELKRFWIKSRLTLKKIYLETRHTHLKDLRNLILKYIKKLPDIIHLRNLVVFSTILSIIILVMFVQRFSALAGYYEKTSPDYGGVYREGVLGNIDKMNPLFASNSAEESADRLVFSGLTRVLAGDKIIPDLAQSWQISDDKTTYAFKLRKDSKWQDGQKVTADDIVYTIELIQNPDTKTNLSPIWKDVKVEKINDYEVKFVLPNPYADFLSVVSQPILPQHILKPVDPKNVKVAEFNSAPIGTGPYKFIRFDQAGNETEAVFAANENFVLQRPYLNEVRLRIYASFDDLYKGFIRKQVDGVAEIPYDRISKIEQQSELNSYQFYLPRDQVMIFNYKNPILSDKTIRKTLSEAINRQAIIAKAVPGQAVPIYAPILPGQVGYDPLLRKETFNVSQANTDLDTAGWPRQADGSRLKDGKVLSFNLVYANDDENTKAAEEIKKEFSQIGVKIQLIPTGISLLQSDYVRPRNFDILLVGQDIGLNPDLYSFWHSSQIVDPGLNLSGFKNREVDKFLEQIRQSNDFKLAADRYKQIQAVLTDETPAIFLYNPIYTIAISRNVRGVPAGKISTPIDHLNNIYQWYINEKTSF